MATAMTETEYGSAQATTEDHIRRAVQLMRRGARMILDGIPNDPTFLCSSFGPDVTGEIARVLAGDPHTAGPDILEALVATRALVSEAAETGFNCHDGDWAERLYANQAAISAAISKATA